MYILAITVHLLISIMLCVVVLLQSSKGDGLAGAFGGGGAGQAVFGARGVTTLLHKATIYLAAAFMISSVALVFLTMREGGGTTSNIGQRAAERVPVGTAPTSNISDQFVPIAPEDIPGADEEAAPVETAPEGAVDTQSSGDDGAAQDENNNASGGDQ